MITKEEFQQWKHHPVTKAALEVLDEALEDIKETPRGRDTIEQTVRDAHKIDGWIECLDELKQFFEYGSGVVNEN